MKRSRVELIELAQRGVHSTVAEARDPSLRIVCIVTDEAGDWVGVSSNVDVVDTQAILVAATTSAGRELPPTSSGCMS